jgi:hypothetical protein
LQERLKNAFSSLFFLTRRQFTGASSVLVYPASKKRFLENSLLSADKNTENTGTGEFLTLIFRFLFFIF